MPDISIIIPAYNDATTLGDTLRSVAAQSYRDWEVIIIDDGSRDKTASIARFMVDADPRFRLISQDNAGASAARNTGIAAASGDWIIFLDADDRLQSDHLERLCRAARAMPDAGVLHGGWRRFRRGALWWKPHPATLPLSPFETAARSCPFAIHSAMTRRHHIVEAGGFDPALRVCEDWDLWQRIARMGVVFAPVADLWADVHVRQGSLSSDSAQLLVNGLAVIRRGHGPDPRVAAAPGYLEGEAKEKLPDALWAFALWAVGAAIGRGGDPLPLLESVGEPVPGTIDVATAVDILEDGMVVGGCLRDGPWPQLWSKVGGGVASLTDWLDAHSRTGVLGRRIANHLESRIMAGLSADVTVTIGSVHQEVIDLSRGIADLILPGVSRLRCIVLFDGQELVRFERPIFGAMSGQALADDIRALVDSPDLRRSVVRGRLRRGPLQYWQAGQGRSLRAFARLWQAHRAQQRIDREEASPENAGLPFEDILDLVYDSAPGLFVAEGMSAAVERIIAEEKAQAAGPPPEADDVASVVPHTRPVHGVDIDYSQQSYWEGIYSNKDPWDYRNNYEALKYDQTIELIAGRHFDDVLEIACAEGEFTRRLAPFATRILATDIAPSAVARAAGNLRDLPNIRCGQLDLLTDDPPGQYDLIVCSEVLYYLADAATLARIAARMSAHLKPGGWFVTADANLLVDEADCTGFDWPHQFGARGIGAAFAAAPGLRMAAEYWTPLYRIHRFEKSTDTSPAEHIVGDTAHPLPARVAEQVCWRGGQDVGGSDRWHDFPILMYHRIVDDGPAGLAQWRTSPDAFEAQLAWLRDHGWRGLSLERMAQALQLNHALPEKTVLLTFDDATRDFLDHALPLLHRYGFPATLFVPTGKVGQTADWDGGYGDPAALLDWDEIRALKHCDVSIGSHGAMHLPLTILSTEQLVRELAGSKAVLEEELGVPVRAIAYPFGDYDPAIREVALQCGYAFGLTCFDGLIDRQADPMVLRRQEVRGGISLEAFAALLGPAGD
ncbi:trifunctional glycosyltransferase/class I SAM-dependent methyltransferase/polysaccharide deacetylase [Sphingobium sp. CAP-1]|uniref:trifunctional glycosyltransferase/class I SAM-dependent methyltransferase/polysaccharide deacetylase n=1 Tax=Sphingobium sp. CAP-1 TaxID=2676077 RepID=UPI0012BB411B|nr:trifunctional glycosyltransferase/class I SAM-dependent methyltransferase/polysaccharide deacetylase [Sphingobium sp. CAP-1]QGP78194.1 glycosyltransferase [Sphingobium sp. CAP-1]